jgi:hypothetical protein
VLWYKCGATPIPNAGAGGALDLTLDAGVVVKSGFSPFQTGGVNDDAILIPDRTLYCKSASNPGINGSGCHIGVWFKPIEAVVNANVCTVWGLTNATHTVAKFGIGLNYLGMTAVYTTTLGASGWTVPYGANQPPVGLLSLAVVTFDGRWVRTYLNGVECCTPLDLGAGHVLDTAIVGDEWCLGKFVPIYVEGLRALYFEAFADSSVPTEADIESWYLAGDPLR